MLPDRWNPRVWLRDWLNKSTPTEKARWDAIWRGENPDSATPKADGGSPPSARPRTSHPRSQAK